MNAEAIKRSTDGFPVSLNHACKLLHKSKGSVRKLLGTRIRVLTTENNQYGCNLYDILELIGKA